MQACARLNLSLCYLSICLSRPHRTAVREQVVLGGGGGGVTTFCVHTLHTHLVLTAPSVYQDYTARLSGSKSCLVVVVVVVVVVSRHFVFTHYTPILCRVGQNRIYTPYMTVFLVISLPKIPKIPYIHRIYMVLANPNLVLTAPNPLCAGRHSAPVHYPICFPPASVFLFRYICWFEITVTL